MNIPLQMNNNVPIGTTISTSMSYTFDGNGWAVNGRVSNVYIQNLFQNHVPQNQMSNETNSDVKSDEEINIKKNDELDSVPKNNTVKIETKFKGNNSFVNKNDQIDFKIPQDQAVMLRSMQNFINDSSSIEEIFSNEFKLSFLDEQNKTDKYVICNTIGLLQTILLSMYWKYRGVPGWCKPNINNKTGYSFSREKYNNFFDDMDKEEEGKGDKYEKNYWNKLKEVIPFLINTFNLESKKFSLNSFLKNKNMYQLKFYISLIGEMYDDTNTKTELINRILTSMKNEINDLNKCLFVITILTVKDIDIDTSTCV